MDRDRDLDDDSFLKPGGAFDGPLWEELLAEPGELSPGARLGPYEIREPIGAGGMGEVYRARDTRLARDVAIKILPAAARTADARARFEREARAVAALSHPNVVAVHDVGTEGDVQFVVTELLDGQSLRRRLADYGALSPAEAIDYGMQIALGLAAAHDRGIVHRDLKPDNIFITRDGDIKILDFGIALYNDTDGDSEATTASLTRTGVYVGTIGYMSPEQVLGQPATTQSDLFGFGVVMYEMLTATHPFSKPTSPEVQTAVLRENPVSLLRIVPGLTPPIVRLIERCLDKQPAQRPKSGRDLALFLEVLGTTDQPPPPTDTSARSPRLRLWAMGALLLLLTAIWSYVQVTTSRSMAAMIDVELARSERLTRYVHDAERTRLAWTARVIASFPELKALFATDAATIRDFLQAYQQRVPGAPVLMAVAADGTVVARTEEVAARDGRAEGWIDALVAAPGQAAIVDTGNRPGVAVAVTLEAGSNVFGYLVAVELIDQRFATAVSDATHDDVVVLSERDMLASTLREPQIPWRSLESWRKDSAGATASEVRIGAQQYAAREVKLADTPAVSVIVVTSRDEGTEDYRALQRGVTIISLVLLAGGLLSVWFLPGIAARLQS